MKKNSNLLELSGINIALIERMRAVNRYWPQQFGSVSQREAEFGSRLLTSQTPAQATDICNE